MTNHLFVHSGENHSKLYTASARCAAVALFSLMVLNGCNTSSVYLDKFDSPTGSTPAQPQVGTSTVSGDAVVVADPTNTSTTDHWLQLTRTAPTATASYVGTLTTPVTAKGGVNFVGYIPSSSPIDLSVYFLPSSGPQGAPLLHVDLLPSGNSIRLNDSDVVGTYNFDHPVGFFITFDLKASPPTATVLIRGGGQDASKTVPVPPSLAGFGFGKIEVDAPFEGVSAKPGKLLINDVIATRASN